MIPSTAEDKLRLKWCKSLIELHTTLQPHPAALVLMQGLSTLLHMILVHDNLDACMHDPESWTLFTLVKKVKAGSVHESGAMWPLEEGHGREKGMLDGVEGM